MPALANGIELWRNIETDQALSGLNHSRTNNIPAMSYNDIAERDKSLYFMHEQTHLMPKYQQNSEFGGSPDQMGGYKSERVGDLYKQQILIMFTYNRINYPVKNRLSKLPLIPNEHSSDLRCMSVKIAESLQVVAFFGIIEELVASNNVMHLTIILNVCRGQQEGLSRSKQDTSSCQRFLSVISQLIKGMGEENQNTTLLKDLYTKRQSIIPYIQYLIHEHFTENGLSQLSLEFKVVISYYTLQSGQEGFQIIRVGEYNQGQQYQNLLEVRVLGIEQGYYLIYPYTQSQLDRISTHYFNCEKRHRQLESSRQSMEALIQNQKKAMEEMKRGDMRLRSECDKLKYENSQLEQLQGNLERDYDEAKKSKQNLQKLNDKAQRDLQEIKRSEQNLQDQMIRLRRENQHQKNVIAQLKRESEDREQNNRNRNKPNNLTQISLQGQMKKPKIRIEETPMDFKKKQPSNPQYFTQEMTVQEQEDYHYQKDMKRDARKNSSPPKRQPPEEKVGFAREKKKTDFLKIQWSNNSTVQEKECKVCLEVEVPYGLFDCNHVSCPVCLIQSIDSNLKEGKLPVCLTDNCCKEGQYRTVVEFLRKQEKMELLNKFQHYFFKKQYRGELFQCPDCRQPFEINPNDKFVNHCNKTFCRKCMSPHSKDQKCDEARYVHALEVLEAPVVCPTCREMFQKIQGCEHMVCPKCKEQHPEGFCERCSAIRSPILNHDNSYHRADCLRYEPHNQAIKRNGKCTECAATPGPASCNKPETFQAFLKTNFSKQFAVKLLQKRAALDAKKKS